MTLLGKYLNFIIFHRFFTQDSESINNTTIVSCHFFEKLLRNKFSNFRFCYCFSGFVSEATKRCWQKVARDECSVTLPKPSKKNCWQIMKYWCRKVLHRNSCLQHLSVYFKAGGRCKIYDRCIYPPLKHFITSVDSKTDQFPLQIFELKNF